MWIDNNTQFVRDRSQCEIRWYDENLAIRLFVTPSFGEPGDPITWNLWFERHAVFPLEYSLDDRPRGGLSIPYRMLPWDTSDAPHERFNGAALSRWLRNHINDVEEFAHKIATEEITGTDVKNKISA